MDKTENPVELFDLHVAHVGINGTDPKDALEIAELFQTMMGLPVIETPVSYFNDTVVEVMKQNGRGLGSSSTCVVAGIMAAAALTGHTVDRAELVRIATEVEGHPDNVAPAILGGAVCSFTPEGDLPRCLRYEVSDRLRFITVIPPYEVHTSEARKVVPQEIPLSTAVWQMGRIAGMTRGLETGDLDLIAAANDDRIQEPYRRRLIPDYNAVRDTCLNGGAKTIWISGSGSTLMAVTDDTIVAKFLQVKLREQFPKCDTHILTCDTEGAQIEYL